MVNISDMKILSLVSLVLLFALASPVHAAPACYSEREATAEKILRLHSELMVITVTCRQGSTGRDLSRAYSRLTRQHINPIKQSEKILMAYYAKKNGGNGQKQLDKLRTKLANQYGQVVARESAAKFCQLRRDQVTRLYDSRRISFESESLRANRHIKLNEPICGNHVKMAQKRRKQPFWD